MSCLAWLLEVSAALRAVAVVHTCCLAACGHGRRPAQAVFCVCQAGVAGAVEGGGQRRSACRPRLARSRGAGGAERRRRCRRAHHGAQTRARAHAWRAGAWHHLPGEETLSYVIDNARERMPCVVRARSLQECSVAQLELSRTGFTHPSHASIMHEVLECPYIMGKPVVTSANLSAGARAQRGHGGRRPQQLERVRHRHAARLPRTLSGRRAARRGCRRAPCGPACAPGGCSARQASRAQGSGGGACGGGRGGGGGASAGRQAWGPAGCGPALRFLAHRAGSRGKSTLSTCP